MFRFFLARVATAVPTLFIIIALSFFLMRLAPGGPFDTERALGPEIAINLRRIYRLDLPLVQQFWFYLQNLAHGDLGPSLHWRDFSVNELFAKALPVSAMLGAQAMLVAIFVGTALGLAGAISESGLGVRVVDGAAMLGIILPVFVVAPLLQLGFGLTLHALPVGGWNDGAWQNQVLPVITLALPQIAIVARLMQAALRDALAMPHIRTLRAFGMPGYHIYIHALRAAFAPVVSYLGLAAANVLTGSVVVETIFGIPGMGRYFVDGALGRDYTLVMGTVIVVAAAVLLFNLIVDLILAWLDPRVRYDSRPR
ncbi:MAG: ABC transporter permease subunit [Pseudomonadota bacterium]|nr:ABC transporter permease subunit [Pseudomonadota bacterium]